MNEQGKSILLKEVVDYMYLVATRNRAEIENRAEDFILTLESQTEPEFQGLLLFVKGITYFFHNNYEEAKAHFTNVFELDSSYTDLWGIAHMGLGFTHRSTGHLDEAVSNLTSAIELIDENGDFKIFVAYCCQSLGEIHITINEYDIAIDYFSRAYSTNNEDQDRSAFFRYHMGLGGCYLKMKEYEKSEYHLTQALEVDNRPPPIISRVENDIGVLYLEMKQFDKAEKYLLSSFNIRMANGLEDAACTSMTALAEVYLEQNKVSKAHDLLNDCLRLVEKFKTKWKKIEVLKLLAKAHSLSKNYELAIGYYEQYIVLYDEIKSEQERNILKFKNEQIEKQRQIISDKHIQLAATFEEIKRLKVNRKAVVFSWITIIILVVISEMILDPFIENYAYNNILSLFVKVLIALLFKPIDGLYEKVLWNRTLKKVS